MKPKRMLVFLFSAVLFMFGSYGDSAFAQAPAGPKLIVPETMFEFGEIHEGDDVRHHFVLINKGTSPVEIIDVKTD